MRWIVFWSGLAFAMLTAAAQLAHPFSSTVFGALFLGAFYAAIREMWRRDWIEEFDEHVSAFCLDMDRAYDAWRKGKEQEQEAGGIGAVGAFLGAVKSALMKIERAFGALAGAGGSRVSCLEAPRRAAFRVPLPRKDESCG